MEVPAVIEGIACGVHIEVEVDKLGIERGGFLGSFSHHAVYIHLLGIIPLVVEGIALVGELHAGVEQHLTVILILAFVKYRALYCSGSVVVVVYHGMFTVVAVLGTGLIPCRSGGTELTVHKQVVEHARVGILLHIDSAALLSVTSPAGTNDGVVVGLNLSLVTYLALVGAGEFQTVGIGAEHGPES